VLLTKEVEYRGKMIPVEKLSRKSSKKLLVKCPKCGEIREVFAKAYFREETGLCHKCALEERTKPIPVGTTFGQWVVIGEGKHSGKSLCRCSCGNEREVRNSSLRSGKSTSCGCSISKARQSQRKYLEVGSKYGRLTVVGSVEAGYSLCVCDCGNKAKVSNWNLEHGIAKSCGCLRRETAAENMRKHIKRGKEHHNWKGGISTEYQRTRATKKFKDFLTMVRERDNHQCQKCGASKSRMHVHHIKPVRFYPELICDPNNGVLLCPKCHREFHRLYGKDAEENELKEYLNN
jgi:5-methylcytosine-specific restriction endonuclease McrA/ribosomal protein S27E